MARLMRRVAVSPTGCWEFTGARNRRGYGLFSAQGLQKILAHRAAWLLRFGALGGRFVLHRCDNPPCVNPAHLFLGTQAENLADMVAKGRHGRGGPRGQRHDMAVLTERDVIEIRRTYSDGGANLPQLAARFGVGKSTVHRVVHRLTWKHVA
jgi:hypothetical protein